MRRLAVLSATALLAAALPALPALPGSAAAGTSPAGNRITLITGDVVTVTPAGGGKYAATIRPAPGRERMRFHTFEVDGELRVLPEDAVGPVSSGEVDGDLFDVQELIEDGYGDNVSSELPLIVSGVNRRSLPGPVRELSSIGGAAVDAAKSGLAELWRRRPGKVWLDGRVRPVLDRSVPQIGAPVAWQKGYDGGGIDVAVLDTGVDRAHPDLTGKVEEARNFTDSPDAEDRFGHGTHVASTAAGVAPGADLLVGKVLNDSGIGYESWIIAGMEWAAGAGAEVVNMSLGGDPTDGTDPLSQAVNRITAQTGTLFVVSAGNSGTEHSVGTPGAADAALTVGAVDRDESLAPFSSRGPRLGDHAIKPDLTAPGVGIVAARAAGTSMGTPVDEHHTAASGTSMAAPHVAGAAALLAQASPDLSPGRLKDLLVSTARSEPGLDVFAQGAGRVDVARAVNQRVFGTGTLSFGVHELPDAGPVIRSASYTNLGSAPVTLDLTLSVPGFRLGSDRITVPAGQTVSVPVTFAAAGLARGRYNGWIVATGNDGVNVRTSVAATVRGRHHQVNFKMRNRSGAFDSSPLVALFGDSREAVRMGWIPPWAGETGVTFDVEEGSYLLHALGADGAPLDEQSTLFTNPELIVDRPMSLVLDARTATPIRIETPRPSEQQTILSYYAQRTHGNGRRILAGVMEFSTTQQVNVTPNRRPSVGSYEFSSRWQLVAPMVQPHVPGVSGPLDVNLLHQSPAYDGRRRFRLVAAGSGTPEELAAASVPGAAVLLTAAEDRSEEEQVAAAAAAGAATVLIVRPADFSAWTVWRPIGERLPIPAMVVAHDDGQRMLARARAGRAVIDLTLTVSSPYLYDVFHVERGRVPEEIVHRVTPANTARVTSRYANAGGFGWAKEQRFGWRPWQEFSWNDTQRMIETPKVREEWISANDSLWQQHVPYFYTWDDMNAVFGATSPPRSYSPGRLGTESWFTPVVRPAASRSNRADDRLLLRVPEFVDAGGHYERYSPWDDKVSAQLWRDGVLLHELPDAWRDVPVPAADGRYRLVLQTERSNEDWIWGTRTSTAWDFRSRRGVGAVPLLQIDYSVPADLNGFVSGRLPHLVGLSAPGGVVAGAEASFDEGKSWRRLLVIGRYAVVPPGVGTVSLRVHARTGDNSVTQTVIRAYGLR